MPIVFRQGELVRADLPDQAGFGIQTKILGQVAFDDDPNNLGDWMQINAKSIFSPDMKWEPYTDINPVWCERKDVWRIPFAMPLQVSAANIRVLLQLSGSRTVNHFQNVA
ncbi:hypothetical protein MAPG_03449 [Magnaporthiopsis poae ATCC 64411]|uniref:Uncharacterized protein n=1 Tax=Magnaporthiopsis poae (strain ATCC 64411 / 73-15) TaxID=644358 RepID=A0A0C4DU15_MAGP6|nr:hypothetical protein MAPG_03449 [Magnaporthiopsis poae ATCC 64411]